MSSPSLTRNGISDLVAATKIQAQSGLRSSSHQSRRNPKGVASHRTSQHGLDAVFVLQSTRDGVPLSAMPSHFRNFTGFLTPEGSPILTAKFTAMHSRGP